MEIKSVSDTGPQIHLSELKVLPLICTLAPVGISPEVEKELKKYEIKRENCVINIPITHQAEEFAKVLALQYEIHIGEAESIALAKQEGAKYFFTDDLDARNTAKMLGLSAHGTLGIILRAFRLKKITKNEAIVLLKKIRETTLFITNELIVDAIKSIEQFNEKR